MEARRARPFPVGTAVPSTPVKQTGQDQAQRAAVTFLTQTKGRRVPGRADRGPIKAPGPPASPHGRARDPPAAGLHFYLCKKIITRVVTEQKKVPFSVVKLVSQSDKARKCGLILSGGVCVRVCGSFNEIESSVLYL